MHTYRTSNVKVSIKLSAVCLNTVIEQCARARVRCRKFHNFVVVYGAYTFTLFKRGSAGVCHVNVCGILCPCYVDSAVAYVCSFTQQQAALSFCIDNITATIDLGRCVGLSHLQQAARSLPDLRSTFNKQKFPGLFIKFERGTAIIFASGKVNIVGVKNEEEILAISRSLCVITAKQSK